jgi:hypothetical protein
MLLKLGEQIRQAYERAEAARGAGEDCRRLSREIQRSALCRTRWLTLAGSLEFARRLEDFSDEVRSEAAPKSLACQSPRVARCDLGEDGWKPSNTSSAREENGYV